MFNGRRIRQKKDGEFQIDMENFVLERLHEIKLDKGKASCKKDEVTEEERAAARAACGAFNWLSKEGRPDTSVSSATRLLGMTAFILKEVRWCCATRQDWSETKESKQTFFAGELARFSVL